jgi:hypothetical protein
VRSLDELFENVFGLDISNNAPQYDDVSILGVYVPSVVVLQFSGTLIAISLSVNVSPLNKQRFPPITNEP